MTSDVFWVFLTVPMSYILTTNYPNQMVYYISTFSKIRYNLTYLPKNLRLRHSWTPELLGTIGHNHETRINFLHQSGIVMHIYINIILS